MNVEPPKRPGWADVPDAVLLDGQPDEPISSAKDGAQVSVKPVVPCSNNRVSRGLSASRSVGKATMAVAVNGPIPSRASRRWQTGSLRDQCSICTS